VEEVAASRKVIADQETLVANLREQLAAAKALIVNGDAAAAAWTKMVEYLERQIANSEAIIAEQRERIARNEAEIVTLRAKVDRGRWATIRNVAITAVVCLGLGYLARGN
jgi:predicted  nucleic acid-binding Zn-ribbon protein